MESAGADDAHKRSSCSSLVVVIVVVVVDSSSSVIMGVGKASIPTSYLFIDDHI